MSKAKKLVDRLIREMQSGRMLNWRQVREDIHEAHDVADTEADRVLCLSIHKTIMDAVEREGLIEEDSLAEFREARRQDYNLLLVKEAVIGRTDGNVPPDKMAAITRREVAAGRMSANDELHRIAIEGEMALAPPRREPRGIGTWVKRLKSHPLWKIGEVAGGLLFLISVVWLFSLAIDDVYWRFGVGITGTIICLVLPGGITVIRWLCSSQFRADWALLHADTVRIPRKDFNRFLGGALTAVQELEDISRHARHRLHMRERPIVQSDLEELIHMLGEAHKRIDAGMASDAAKVIEAADTELDWSAIDVVFIPTIQMTKSPKVIVDLIVNAATNGAKSAKAVYELAAAEMDAVVARYYVTLNTGMNKEDSSSAIWSCYPTASRPQR